MPLKQQIYLGLADGYLHDQEQELAELVQDTCDWLKPDRVITTGVDGYDGHLDHIATHVAARVALKSMLAAGRGIELLGLSEKHEGEVWLTGDINRKLGAMGLHTSQVIAPDLLQWEG